MITVWGGQTSRAIRVAWVLEEMDLPYRQVHSRRHLGDLCPRPGSQPRRVPPRRRRAAYLARTKGRDTYKRALERSREGVAQP